MKHVFAPLLALSLIATAPPTAAQDSTDPPDEGRSLMEDGARLFLEGLMEEMNPALEELEGLARELGPQMRDFAEAMGPALRDLLREIEDWSVYGPPEILPNGDILIRRKTPLPDAPGSDSPDPEGDAPAEPDGPVDL